MRNNLIFFLWITSFFFASSCSNDDLYEEVKPQINHVIIIGVDGWDSASFDTANIPNIKALKGGGAWTLEKRSVLPSSSAPNWISMFTGLGVEQHGYTEWGGQTPTLPSIYDDGRGCCPTIFTLLRNDRPDSEIGCIYEWETLKYYIDTTSVNYFNNFDQSESDRLCKEAVTYIKEKKPNLFAVIYDQLDHAGHAHGWDTPEYISKLEEIDNYIGLILQAVKASLPLDETVIILTSDHGGINTDHGGNTKNEIETPFIISGSSYKNKKIYTPMFQYDVASIVASLFKLQQPSYWIGHPIEILKGN